MFLGLRRRGRWVVPVLLTMVGSLLAVSALPVAGRDGEADNPAIYSACVGAATDSAGFGDMVGSFAEAAADCLAHYGITRGTSAGEFSPNLAVPRWQMALFLVRAAGPAGVVVPPPSDQGFADFDRLGAHTRDAINQLAALGIMQGTTALTFSPDAPVTRLQMAVLLSRFLEAAPTGPGGTDIDDVKPDDDIFRDLGGVPFSTYGAIRRLYELGVTSGTSAVTFSPQAPVSRAQMAAFITRMLAHTNARPAGLSVQTVTTEVYENSEVDLSISLRDPGHQPLADEYVDIFTASDPTGAFDGEGGCTVEVAASRGRSACLVDGSDESTDPGGNLSIAIDVGEADRLRIWIWTGDLGDSFDDDTTDSSTIDITTRKDASAIEVSDDLPPSARKVRFGDSVTFAFQLVDDGGNQVARSGVRFTIRVEESRDDGRRFERTTTTKETGPDGRAHLTFRQTDPSDEPGDVARLDLDITGSGNLMISDATTIGMVRDDDRNDDPLLDWTDERAQPTTLELTLAKPYQLASDAGDGAANTVRATLTDQYGGPVVRERIAFTSDDPAGLPSGVRRSTNSGGVATLNYLRDSADSSTERITARFEDLIDSVSHHWVMLVSGSGRGAGTVLEADTENDVIVVVGSNEAVIIEYDDNDQFRVGNAAVRMSAFEEDLDVGDTLAYEITGPGKSLVNLFILTNR